MKSPKTVAGWMLYLSFLALVTPPLLLLIAFLLWMSFAMFRIALGL